MTATPAPPSPLTRQQLDAVLAGNVRARAQLQDQVARGLVDIDARTRRIEQLLDQRALAPS